METFISWSGTRSKAVAEAIRQWLPKVIQSAHPWMSAEDISAGARWLTDVAGSLNSAKVGIICVTPENQHNPWLLFEAGALSKTLEQTRVCPLTFEMSPAQIKGPLSQFQGNELNRAGIGRVLKTINENINSGRVIDDAALEEIIDVWWPKLEERLKQIPPAEAATPLRSVDDQLDELLLLAREQLRRENLRLEASRDRDEKSEQMIQMMERAGILMNRVDKNAQKMHSVLGKMHDAPVGAHLENSLVPAELQSQLQQHLLEMISPNLTGVTSGIDLQGMVHMIKEMHEKDKQRTNAMLESKDSESNSDNIGNDNK